MKGVRPKHGEKTLEVTVRFFTDETASGGKRAQKVAWGRGMVYMKANKAHGITGHESPAAFNSPFEISKAIETTLKRNEIRIRPIGGVFQA